MPEWVDGRARKLVLSFFKQGAGEIADFVSCFSFLKILNMFLLGTIQDLFSEVYDFNHLTVMFRIVYKPFLKVSWYPAHVN
jgi:hypothetical protein